MAGITADRAVRSIAAVLVEMEEVIGIMRVGGLLADIGTGRYSGIVGDMDGLVRMIRKLDYGPLKEMYKKCRDLADKFSLPSRVWLLRDAEPEIVLEDNPENRAIRILRNNRQYIIETGSSFSVDPAIIAACIYGEQRLNVTMIDAVTDAWLYFLDTSIGIGQVRISTAKIVEDNGYMPITLPVNNHGVYFSREKIILAKLMDERTNIRYIAACLRYYQDRWRNAYPGIDSDEGILTTLYNQGERLPPHASPEPNFFGQFVQSNYSQIKAIMEVE